jgi:hypothetical protein
MVLVRDPHGLLTRPGFPDDHHIWFGLKQAAEPVPDHLVVIHKDQADLIHSHLPGSLIATMVRGQAALSERRHILACPYVVEPRKVKRPRSRASPFVYPMTPEEGSS